jgi:hypothetical protein
LQSRSQFPMQTMLELAGGAIFLFGALIVIVRGRSRSPAKRLAQDLSVSRTWLEEHQVRHVGE